MSLDKTVLSILDIFQTMSVTSRTELDKQALLLEGLDADLEIIGRVNVHLEFLSAGVRKAIEGGDRPRTLGDYVSYQKMKQVADTCAKTHGGFYPYLNREVY